MSDPQKKRQRFNEGPVSPREAARRKAQLEDYEGLPVDLIKLYDNFTFLGRGSFGEVLGAYLKTDDKKNSPVAVKRIYLAVKNAEILDKVTDFVNLKSGMNEIANFQKVQKVTDHPNLVKFIDGSSSKKIFYDRDGNEIKVPAIDIFLEKCELSLRQALKSFKIFNTKISSAEVKTICKHIFNGLNHLHKNNLLHRDLKPSNVLISSEGVVKLCDLGSAREFDPNSKDILMTGGQVTQWYRAPEMLLGSQEYDTAIDYWALGCIMGEIFSGSALFQGQLGLTLDQLQAIEQLCGSINDKEWLEVVDLKYYQKFKEELSRKKSSKRKRRVTDYFKGLVDDENVHSLLEKLLTLNPSERLKKLDSSFNSYFDSEPEALEKLRITLRMQLGQAVTVGPGSDNTDQFPAFLNANTT